MHSKIEMTKSWERYLIPGSELIWAGNHCRVLHWKNASSDQHKYISPESYLVIEQPETRKQRQIPIADVCLAIETGQLSPRKGEDTSDLLASTHIVNGKNQPANRSEASNRYVLNIQNWIAAFRTKNIFYVKPKDPIHIQAHEDLKASMKDDLHDISIWTIYRAQKKLKEACGDIAAIIPKFEQRGWPHSKITEHIKISRIHPAIDKKLNELIANASTDSAHKMRPFKIRKDLRTYIEESPEMFKNEPGIILPSAVTVSKRIKASHSQYDLDCHRYSTETAKKLYRSNGTRIDAERILEAVQFDDIDTRLFLIDPDTGRPWGTAYMTCGIDERSRAVMGANISAEYRNTESAIATLFHCIRQKDMSADVFEMCKKSWPMHGMPGLAVLDNASYNKSDSFKLSLQSMGIDFALARPKTPTNKSAVEYFNFRVKHHFIADLPGSCVNKNDPDGAKRAMKTAKYTMEEFSQKLFHHICDEYLYQPMEEGYSPAEIWSSQLEFVDLRDPPLRDLNFIRYFLIEELTLRESGGILRNQLRYCNSELEDLRRRIGTKAMVNIRVNPAAIADIYVEDKERKCWFSVPCTENENYLHGLSDSLHSLILKCARSTKNDLRIGSNWQIDGKGDLSSLALKLCQDNALSKRGHGFRIKELLKKDKAINGRKGDNRIYEYSAPPQIYAEPKVSVPKNPAPVQTKMDSEFEKLLAVAMAHNST